jgi:2-polyprenyl-3-methyl-5-hydroxy-6-metoxy-1,4-benzoquinol methylase
VRRLENAIQGYGAFMIASMRLQIIFQENPEYKNKTYEEAAKEAYQNRDYMFNLYLPGIYLSHFLWRHHYRQHVFYKKEFAPLVQDHGGKQFYDIGLGTGFYSREMLRIIPEIRGEGFDLSPFSLGYTEMMLSASDLANRYSVTLQNIITEPVQTPAPFIINIEVLEHLENPQAFLAGFFDMLEPGGYGLISAAINAPNADDIYLYRTPRDVIDQIENAGGRIG